MNKKVEFICKGCGANIKCEELEDYPFPEDAKETKTCLYCAATSKETDAEFLTAMALEYDLKFGRMK